MSDRWQKFQIISQFGIQFVGIILIPCIIFIVTNRITNAIKERETQAKYVELAINILKEPPKKEETELKYQKELRTWAFKVMKRYSVIEISENLEKEIINNKPLVIGESHGTKFNGMPISKWGGVSGVKFPWEK